MRNYAWLILSMGLTLGLLGCGDSESNGGAGSGGNGAGGSGGSNGTATVSGTVYSAVLEGEPTELVGATVAVVGGASTTSVANGAFSLQAPVGTVTFLTTAANAWGELVIEEVPPGGEDMAEAEVVPQEVVDQVAGALMETIDPGKGMVIVEFPGETAAGEESADLGSTYGFAFVFDAEGNPKLGTELEAGADNQVIFANVDVTSDVMPSATGPGGGACTIAFAGTAYPAQAKVFTVVDVVSCP